MNIHHNCHESGKCYFKRISHAEELLAERSRENKVHGKYLAATGVPRPDQRVAGRSGVPDCEGGPALEDFFFPLRSHLPFIFLKKD